MRIGIDIVEIKELKSKMKNSPGLINRLLSLEERTADVESLAGKIAAKEAIVKTGYLKVGDWLKIKILNLESGEPVAYDSLGRKIRGLRLSITHSKKIAAAVAIFEAGK